MGLQSTKTIKVTPVIYNAFSLVPKDMMKQNNKFETQVKGEKETNKGYIIGSTSLLMVKGHNMMFFLYTFALLEDISEFGKSTLNLFAWHDGKKFHSNSSIF